MIERTCPNCNKTYEDEEDEVDFERDYSWRD